jgi:hypothetical protein
MRSIPFFAYVLLAVLGCGGAKLDKASPQYAEVHALGAAELRCPENKVKVSAAGESRVVVSGCDKSTPYVLACRKPGARELEYLSNTPAPPSDEEVEALSQSSDPADQGRVLEQRQQQIAYSQGLVAIRLEDLKSGEVAGQVLRHQLPRVPESWVRAECRYMHEP